MKRQVWGILATILTAPYLVGLMMGLFVEINDVATHGEGFEILELLKFLPISTIALVIAGIPLLIVASVWAALLNIFECRTKWGPVLSGMLTSFCFVTVLTSGSSNTGEDWLLILAMSILPGAMCGWIYWRIAIRQTPQNSRPITTP